jgi:hypothetical protein
MRKISLICTAVAILGLAGFAQGLTVDYTVSAWGPQSFPSDLIPPVGSPWGPNGYPGDTLEFATYTGTLDLTPGTYVQKINTLLWKIDYTYGGTPEPWPDMTLDCDTTRNMSFGGGPAGAISQTSDLLVNYWNDYLSLLAGSTTSFIVQGYRVDVTPLSLDSVGGTNFSGGNPWAQPDRDVMAQFEVTAIPEPLTMLGVFLGLGSVGAYIRRRRMG